VYQTQPGAVGLAPGNFNSLMYIAPTYNTVFAMYSSIGNRHHLILAPWILHKLHGGKNGMEDDGKPQCKTLVRLSLQMSNQQ
jgi:hypothetical protein